MPLATTNSDPLLLAEDLERFFDDVKERARLSTGGAAYYRALTPEQQVTYRVAMASAIVQSGDYADGKARAAQAFAAAGRPTPLIIMGNRQDELQWWKEQKDANGYETMSVSIAPGVSTLAFWVAQMILDGKTVRKVIVVPKKMVNLVVG